MEAASCGMCAVVLRSTDEWEVHPQREALRNALPVQIIKRGEAPKRKVNSQEGISGLHGVRVLDLTRVLAGPICGRTLAEYGADVTWITSPYLPSLPLVDADTSRQKRPLQLDLTSSEDRDRLKEELKSCDVFLQAYRPGGLAAKGFGVSELIAMRPEGIVCANITAYGYEGPWKDRRGFDSLVQTATGIASDEGRAHQAYSARSHPLNTGEEQNESNKAQDESCYRPLPMQAIDHATAYLTALGINIALGKQLEEGGSWEVRTSLAATGQWLRSLGRVGLGGGNGTAGAGAGVGVGEGMKLPESSVPMPLEVQEMVEDFESASVPNGVKVKGLRHSARMNLCEEV